ncbi:hypothetical protein [Christiangramia salexigens]|uniref:DUF2834 domain-containing protein n=1 Tax=Christiangramia salexigens TaxID=1913577 RepID=A0A1L3J1D0_9FLAO|nr:hypothetical protein [Christiangramia salexigens]APG58929.1 hypothetical protein LPB144_00230 [Christiangramia salexigens]
MIEFFLRHKLVVTVFYYLFWGNSFILHILSISGDTFLLLNILCKLLAFFIWLVVLVDMMKYKIKDKTFWVLSMIFISFFTPVVYLYRRENLFNLKQNRFRSFL